MYLTPIGEDTLILCDHCGYTAPIARWHASAKPCPCGDATTATRGGDPNCKTIEELANFLACRIQNAKAVLYGRLPSPKGKKDVDRLVFAIVRGE